jgi:uncharacterized protein YaaW (UPF0174 family)
MDQLPLSLQKNPMALVVKGGSALALNSVVQPMLLQLIARQFALHFAQYQVAQQAALQGGLAIQQQVAMHMARRGMAMATARYTATRAAFAFVGSALWMWFIADLGWRTIATNYGRVIPIIFTLAQIRLTRTECWEAI